MPAPNLLKGLAPIVDKHAKVLILGSMPSSASIEKQQYYGHPRNAFWRLLAELSGFSFFDDYEKNVAHAQQNGIAIWDVIGQCERKGSLDSAVVKGSEVLNPISTLLAQHQNIEHIGLNGGFAAQLFVRHCQPTLLKNTYNIHKLPSTSPANARMCFAQKVAAWRPLFNPSHRP